MERLRNEATELLEQRTQSEKLHDTERVAKRPGLGAHGWGLASHCPS